MSSTPRHSVSVAGAVINDDGRILAIRRADNGHWEPPGGVLEVDETSEDGLIREIHEETGLTVKPERLTGVYKNMERGIIALVFRCSSTDGSSKRSDETDEIAWLTCSTPWTNSDRPFGRMTVAASSKPTFSEVQSCLRMAL